MGGFLTCFSLFFLLTNSVKRRQQQQKKEKQREESDMHGDTAVGSRNGWLHFRRILLRRSSTEMDRSAPIGYSTLRKKKSKQINKSNKTKENLLERRNQPEAKTKMAPRLVIDFVALVSLAGSSRPLRPAMPMDVPLRSFECHQLRPLMSEKENCVFCSLSLSVT